MFGKYSESRSTTIQIVILRTSVYVFTLNQVDVGSSIDIVILFVLFFDGIGFGMVHNRVFSNLCWYSNAFTGDVYTWARKLFLIKRWSSNRKVPLRIHILFIFIQYRINDFLNCLNISFILGTFSKSFQKFRFFSKWALTRLFVNFRYLLIKNILLLNWSYCWFYFYFWPQFRSIWFDLWYLIRINLRTNIRFRFIIFVHYLNYQVHLNFNSGLLFINQLFQIFNHISHINHFVFNKSVHMLNLFFLLIISLGHQNPLNLIIFQTINHLIPTFIHFIN